MFHNNNKSSNIIKIAITVPYKVDTGSDGNIMPFHIYKMVFPKATKEQLLATRNTNIQVKKIKEQKHN